MSATPRLPLHSSDVRLMLSLRGKRSPPLKKGDIGHSDRFALSGDPVGAGLVTSLSRPGGNVTGLSNRQSDLAGKRIELLREVLPVCAGWQSWQMSPMPSRFWK